MATTTLNGSTTRNNGGAIFGLGSTINGPITEGVPYGRPYSSVFASTPVSGVGVGIQKFNTNGNFATLVAGEYQIFGVATKIAGQTTTAMKYTGTSIAQRNNVNYRTTRKTYIPLWYDYLTGTNSGVISDDSFGTDDEATNVGRAWNGEYTHMLTGATPKLYDYPVKTG